MITHWTRFMDDRKYLRNCSEPTLYSYHCAWQACKAWMPTEPVQVTPEVLRTLIIELRRSGLCTISVNSYLRSMNVFLRWVGCPTAPYQIAPQLTPATMTMDQIMTLIQVHSESENERRVALAVAIVADTGLRASEVLAIQKPNVNIEELTILVHLGKGRKDRIVPISKALRRRLLEPVRGGSESLWLFATRAGTPLSYRNSLRDLVALAKRLGVSGPRISWHTIRHSFATNYIRSGGSVTMLQRVLGHTTVAMTMRYVHIQTQDLRDVHDRFTMLR